MKRMHVALVCGSVLWICAGSPQAREEPPSFRARSQAFWSAFEKHADEYRQALLSGDAGKIGEVKAALGARIDELVPGLKFGADLGPSPDAVRIDLAPGDDCTRQLLGRELAESMPRIQGWSCEPWRPPADPSRTLGKIGSADLLPRDFRVYCEWDSEEPRLSLAVWHAGITKLGKADGEALAKRFVDRALGAAMLKRTPHSVRVLESEPEADTEGVVAGDVLYTTLVEYLKSENFDAATPPELAESYYGPPSGEHAAKSRLGDVLSGASRYMDLVADFNLDMGTSTLDALSKCGGGAGYVGFTHTLERVPLDPESGLAWIALRNEVSQTLDAQLKAAHAGTVVGFGDGATRVWLDVLFFDEKAATPILKSVLAADARVTTAELYAFDRRRPDPRTTLK